MEQNEMIMSNIYVAWRTWHIHDYKTAEQHTDADKEWTREWVFGGKSSRLT